MRKLLLSLVAIACYATAIWAVPAPVNVRWDNDTLRWELPELINDSAYALICLRAFLSHHCDNPQVCYL